MKSHLLINGQNRSGTTDRWFTRKDPVSGDTATEAVAATKEDVLAAVAAAQAAFASWSMTSPQVRRDLLNKAADAMEARSEDFVNAAVSETGATRPWIAFNVGLAAGILREAASMVTQANGEVLASNKPDCMSLSVVRPRGVCVGIAPWNAPVILATRAIAVPVALGNTAILKSSEMCPETHRLIGQCFTDAGFPPGVVNIISNDPADAAEVVETLVRAPEVRHVNFTGSSHVGRIIGRLCGENLKPCLLELGGKAPFIVLDDANVDAAVNAAIFGCYMNQGQICMSTERMIVDESIADEFAEKFAARAKALPAGDPRGEVVLGALCLPGAGEKMDKLIEDAVSKGGKVLAGGTREQSIFTATVIDHVTPEMRIWSEESFGPVKPIIRVRGVEEAIEVANGSEYGLSAAVFGQDIRRAMAVANRVESGICHINGATVADEPQVPFGGVKSSGFGRFGGKSGMAEFTDVRWITIEDPDQHYPF